MSDIDFPGKEKTGKKTILLGAFFVAVIVSVCILAFYDVLHYEFVYDDFELVVRNSDIRDLSLESLRSMFFNKDYVNFLPVRMLSYAVDYHFYGLDPYIYHLTNLIFHTADSILVFLIVYWLLTRVLNRPFEKRKSMAAALVAALFFSLHPIHVEAVTWISGRKEVLYSFFLLMGFYGYIRYRVHGEPRMVGGGFIAALLCFLAGMMSKGTALAFPLLLLTFDLAFPAIARRTKLSRRIQEHVTMFIVLVILMTLNVKLATRESMFAAPFGGGSASHLLTISKIIPFYLRLIFLPDALSAVYDVPVAHSVFEPMTALSVFIMIALGAMIILTWRRQPIVAFGICWFIVALGPTLNVIPFGTFAADRYAYLPLFGLCLIAGMIFAELWSRGATLRLVAIAATIAIAVSCFIVTNGRNRIWKDQTAFWTATRKTAPKNAEVSVGLAMTYMDDMRYDDALAELKQALKLDPKSGLVYTGFALYYLTMKDLPNAEKVIKLGMKRDPFSSKLHFHYGILQYEKGDYKSAARVFAFVKKEKPGYQGVDEYLFKTIMKLRHQMSQKEFTDFLKSL